MLGFLWEIKKNRYHPAFWISRSFLSFYIVAFFWDMSLSQDLPQFIVPPTLGRSGNPNLAFEWALSYAVVSNAHLSNVLHLCLNVSALFPAASSSASVPDGEFVETSLHPATRLIDFWASFPGSCGSSLESVFTFVSDCLSIVTIVRRDRSLLLIEQLRFHKYGNISLLMSHRHSCLKLSLLWLDRCCCPRALHTPWRTPPPPPTHPFASTSLTPPLPLGCAFDCICAAHAVWSCWSWQLRFLSQRITSAELPAATSARRPPPSHQSPLHKWWGLWVTSTDAAEAQSLFWVHVGSASQKGPNSSVGCRNLKAVWEVRSWTVITFSVWGILTRGRQDSWTPFC